MSVRISSRTLGLVMAFGSGVLISAVSFELVQEAFDTSSWHGAVALGLLAGSVSFFTGDWLIDRSGGGDRKHSGGRQADGNGLAIVLGIVLDGIPESFVLGLTVLQAGTVSAAFLAAVFISNVPEAIAATSGLLQSG
jgi:zinc transporter, ZIP family